MLPGVPLSNFIDGIHRTLVPYGPLRLPMPCPGTLIFFALSSAFLVLDPVRAWLVTCASQASPPQAPARSPCP